MAEALAHDARARRARFSVNVLLGLTLSFFSPGFFVSAHSVSVPDPVLVAIRLSAPFRAIRALASPLSTGPRSAPSADSARQERLACRARQAGLHVSHLTARMPNPIARRCKHVDHRDFIGDLRPRCGAARPAACATPSAAASEAWISAEPHGRGSSAASTLAKPADHRAGLVGDRQSIERRALQQAFGRVRQDPAAHRTSRLKPRAKTRRLTASASACAGRRDPEAAARQPALEIGHDRAVRRRPRNGSGRRPASPAR